MPAPDVLILGAGAAGLSAAVDLARAGLKVEILEARDRIGGRIFTQHDPTLNHAIELGAEFVHGLAPEIWLPLRQNNLNVTEVEGDLWCSVDGKLRKCDFFEQADKILAAMDDDSPDESFLDFLNRRFPGDDHANAKQWATGYVSGFNAADPAETSVHWLVHNRHAEEQIEGDRAFRITGGYGKLLEIFLQELPHSESSTKVNHGGAGVPARAPVRLNTIVREIHWRPGSVEINAQTAQGDTTFTAPRVLLTLPLGVLQATRASVSFEPSLPEEKRIALQKLAMGKVIRVTLCFRERFWQKIKSPEENKTLSNLSFLFSHDSHDDLFPTWWRQMPEHIPIITGWAPAKSAECLAGMTEGRVIDKALETLSNLLHVGKPHVQSQLVAAYYHDWESD